MQRQSASMVNGMKGRYGWDIGILSNGEVISLRKG